jgi:hypothetical protein
MMLSLRAAQALLALPRPIDNHALCGRSICALTDVTLCECAKVTRARALCDDCERLS